MAEPSQKPGGSIMQYSCLAWMNASQTTYRQPDIIQKKAVKILDVNEDCALKDYTRAIQLWI